MLGFPPAFTSWTILDLAFLLRTFSEEKKNQERLARPPGRGSSLVFCTWLAAQALSIPESTRGSYCAHTATVPGVLLTQLESPPRPHSRLQPASCRVPLEREGLPGCESSWVRKRGEVSASLALRWMLLRSPCPGRPQDGLALVAADCRTLSSWKSS